MSGSDRSLAVLELPDTGLCDEKNWCLSLSQYCNNIMHMRKVADMLTLSTRFFVYFVFCRTKGCAMKISTSKWGFQSLSIEGK